MSESMVFMDDYVREDIYGKLYLRRRVSMEHYVPEEGIHGRLCPRRGYSWTIMSAKRVFMDDHVREKVDTISTDAASKQNEEERARGDERLIVGRGRAVPGIRRGRALCRGYGGGGRCAGDTLEQCVTEPRHGGVGLKSKIEIGGGGKR